MGYSENEYRSQIDMHPKKSDTIGGAYFYGKKKKRKRKMLDRIQAIMDMREHHLGYCETVRKYWDTNQGQEENYKIQ